MVSFRRVPEAEVAARHAARSAPPRGTRLSAPANLRAVLDLGAVSAFAFRGRGYVVPPVSYRLGAELLALRFALEETTVQGRIRPERQADYFAAIRRMARLIWRHVRPAARWQRWGRRLGLVRNPFDGASEGEVVQIVDFFCTRRTRPTVGFPVRLTVPGAEQTPLMI